MVHHEMKWVALSLIILGIAAVIAAFRMSSTSNLNDGTIVLEVLLLIAGVSIFIAGVVIFVVLFFMSL